MALKIRLSRGGAKKRPFYRIVVAEASSPRDGRFVEKVGTYNPLLEHGHAERIVLNKERITHWLSVGAQPTERVELFLSNAGLVAKKERTADPKKSAPKKRAQERAAEQVKAEQAAREAAEAARVAAQEEAAKKVEEPVVEAAPAPVEEAPIEEASVALEAENAPAAE